MKRKGFSLIELVVTIAIIAILGLIMVPSVINSLQDGKIDNDESYVKQLTNTVRMGAQETKTYYNLTRICEETEEQYVEIVFESDFNGNFSYKEMKDVNYTSEPATDRAAENREKYRTTFEQSLKDYISGTIEMTPMQSELYRNRELTIRIALTNRDYQVNITSEWSEIDE